MDKQYLLSVIDKYHLNGIVERTSWSVESDIVGIKFISEAKDLVGVIRAPGFEDIKHQEIAVFNTSQLYKLITVTGQFLTLAYKSDKVPKLLIADNQYNLEYVLGDIGRIPKSAKVDEPEYTIEFIISKELIEGFIRAKKALNDVELVTIESVIDSTNSQVISFTIGNIDAHSHKVNFTTPASKMDIPSNSIVFNANYLKEIFSNNRDFTKGLGYLSEEGLLKLDFWSETQIQSTYYMIARD
jgi:hypothetical protein